MKNFLDNTPKNRLLGILKSLLERPYHHTKRMFADAYGVDDSTIKKDFEELRNADFTLNYDSKYRYAIAPNKSVEHLQDVLFFTENEQEILVKALATYQQTNEEQKEKLRKKLETVYDVSKLGSSLFSKTFLNKVDLLEKAKKEKKVIKLINYHSTNSNKVSDRLLEPFLVGVKEDILHCFDLDINEIRHFRISRIRRVELLHENWKNETKHYVTATDPFRIVNNEQVKVHIKVGIGGYNELIERYPLTQAYLKPCADKADVFDFECKVNKNFYGLINFLLGYHEFIEEIIEPESLLEHIHERIKKINSKF
ncbi:MAG: WYL domain-containing protein [Thermonemataceae bacterium]|nr:WYL domain-containing protein [Thermonemataceae bacterium]